MIEKQDASPKPPIKDEYTWFKPGGEKILESLEGDLSNYVDEDSVS